MKFNNISLLILPFTVATAVHAADNIPTNTSLAPTGTIFRSGSIERSDAKRASELLDRAVDYIQHYGSEKSFGAFNDRKSVFVS